jgi:hypothetical protein
MSLCEAARKIERFYFKRQYETVPESFKRGQSCAIYFQALALCSAQR